MGGSFRHPQVRGRPRGGCPARPRSRLQRLLSRKHERGRSAREHALSRCPYVLLTDRCPGGGAHRRPSVSSRRPLRWLRWTIAAVAAVVLLAVGGTFVYIHFIEGPAPAPLSLKVTKGHVSTSLGQPASSASLAGTWRVAAGSQAGYRVKEVLLGQNNIAVGRTSHVGGDLTIKGSTVTA